MPATAAPVPSATTASRASSGSPSAPSTVDRGVRGVPSTDRTVIPWRNVTPRTRERRVERSLQRAIADDVAERRRGPASAAPARIRPKPPACETSMRVIGVTRVGRRRERAPHAEPLEDEPRAVRQRERAVAAQRLADARASSTTTSRSSSASASASVEPTGPAPDDDHVVQHQRLQAASTSATDFGAATVRLSMPIAVTSTSSSMRTPMSQNSSGTSSAGRM